MLNQQETKILSALEEAAAGRDVEIVTVSILGGSRSPILRIYIDTPEGVGIEALTAAQSWIGDVIEALDPFPGSYSLEVSSPGIDRPLRTPDHFRRFAGQKATVKTREALDGRKSHTGIIGAVDEGGVELAIDGAPVRIPYDAMKNAHLIGTVDFSS